jgi:signal transduction histidine kinase
VGLEYEYQDVRVEHVLAVSRLLVALTSLAAWLVHLGDSSAHYRVGLLLLLGYVIASLALLVILQRGGNPTPSFVVSAQVNEVGWPALLCLLTEAPNTIFFLLFLFAVIAAAFRGGLVEAMATALISVTLVLFQAAMVAHGPLTLRDQLFAPGEPARVLLHCAFLLMAAPLLGLLAETEKQARAEIALTNHLLSLTRVGSRFATVLQNVLSELGQVFRGRAVYEVAAQGSSGRAFRWEIPSLADPTIHVREIAPADKPFEMMPDYPHTFFMRRTGSSGACTITALDEAGRRLKDSNTKSLQMPVPEANSLLVVSHEMGSDWRGRLVFLDARLGRRREHELRFAQNVMRQVAPALYSVYLFRGFRSRAGAAERARVARELHDTTIQSLISIEMQVDVLRRHNSDCQVSVELGHVQELLRNEVLNLRELTQNMRPIDIGSHQLLDFMAELVERFSRDTGIAVRFVSELHEVTFTDSTCRELVRVVQEGLVNIRKHSGAKSALVRFSTQDGFWKLVITDDGNGFPFTGRFTMTELDRLRRGPAIIKERVRAVGGDMVIESTPGHGSRLEITIPQKGHELYG